MRNSLKDYYEGVFQIQRELRRCIAVSEDQVALLRKMLVKERGRLSEYAMKTKGVAPPVKKLGLML